MENQFSRTELLLGTEAVNRLRRARVAVFGLGGVGGYALEALARSGIGTLDLIDNDCIGISNLNRQLLATHGTLGMRKVDAARARVLSICPQTQVNAMALFFLPQEAGVFDFSGYDYIVDAVDTVTAKLCLAQSAYASHTPIISCMGTGNRLDLTALRVADISETSGCPLARIMRRELKKRGIPHLKVVFSTEPPVSPREALFTASGKPIPGSCAFVPAAAGLLLAQEVVKALVRAAASPETAAPAP